MTAHETKYNCYYLIVDFLGILCYKFITGTPFYYDNFIINYKTINTSLQYEVYR